MGNILESFVKLVYIEERNEINWQNCIIIASVIVGFYFAFKQHSNSMKSVMTDLIQRAKTENQTVIESLVSNNGKMADTLMNNIRTLTDALTNTFSQMNQTLLNRIGTLAKDNSELKDKLVLVTKEAQARALEETKINETLKIVLNILNGLKTK